MTTIDRDAVSMNRRDLLRMIGVAAGGAVMYQAMSSLGYAAESTYQKPLKLEGHVGGASVLILGAGLAGLVAAYELRRAGYKVQVLEYNARAGGRNWSLRGGDKYTELGGFAQNCQFDKGLYFNPGPWRIPYHHHAILDYCKRLGVMLEPFVQVNNNAFLHSKDAFGGKPQRYRTVKADYNGHIAELLAKATQQGKLDETVSKEDREILLESLRNFGALDKNFAYLMNENSSDRRGYSKEAGGGVNGKPQLSAPNSLHDVLGSKMWENIDADEHYEYQTTLMQPVGGMDMVSRAFVREVGDTIRYNAKVTRIEQDGQSVTVNFEDVNAPGVVHQAHADWCLCTIPLSILSQIPMQVSAPMIEAIGAVPYLASAKIGLQFSRRFWEEDERIYGGNSYTDLPIGMIGYPSHGIGSEKGVLLGSYTFGMGALEFTALSPEMRIKKALEDGSQIHPQYRETFQHGMSVAWHRSPSTLGCFGMWSDAAREKHYQNLCQVDGRIALAGEHASYLPAWQEGAILSSLDAIERMHQRVMAGVRT
jgi:monoamine oxidase